MNRASALDVTAHIGIGHERAADQKKKSGYRLMKSPKPYYETTLGAAYLGDSLKLMKKIPDGKINLIMTSPPFALNKKKPYGNEVASCYIKWFKPFAREFFRILADDGSLVIHIGGSWDKGQPTRSLYHFELLSEMCKPKHNRYKFYLAQDFYWYNPAKLPSPAEWVTIRRIRAKDAVDPIWWLSKSTSPKADNRKVLQQYSKAMERLLENGYNAGPRPSGHNISAKFQTDCGGSIPPNFLAISNTESNGDYLSSCRANGLAAHPARYPVQLPEFFIKFLTNEMDIVLDPFGGSNSTGRAAENVNRHWLCFEADHSYLDGSKYRFVAPQTTLK